MDSVFNDIEFLMENMKQEPTANNPNEQTFAMDNKNIKQETGHTNEPGEQGLAVQNNNDTDVMPTFMTDFILDYINRSLKSEDEEVEQSTNDATDQANDDENVADLIERAESMIRENMAQNNQTNIPETSTSVVNNQWLEELSAHLEASANNNPTTSEQNSHTITNNLLGPSDSPVTIEVSDVISVISDTDSDDEVIFVNSHNPQTEIPVIDLSDHSSPSGDDVVQVIPDRHDASRKRAGEPAVHLSSPPKVPVPIERPQEKQFRHNCAICLDDVKSPHSTTCGHIYCGDCIKNALKIFKKCPSCNKKLKVSNVHPIYL